MSRIRRVSFLALGVALCVPIAVSSFDVRPAAADGVKLTPYGFVRLEMAYDDSRTNNPQFPIFVNSEPAGAEDQGQVNWYVQPTRLGLNMASPNVAPEVDLSGKIEVDFYGSASGATDTRTHIRMRHSYLAIDNRGFQFLVGQYWSVISPTYPTFNQAVGWNAGSPGDRRRQIRVTYGATVGGDGKLDVIVAAVPAGGIDNQDLDGDGIKDGNAAMIPGFMSRLTLKKTLWGKQPMEIGVWGGFHREVLGTPLIDMNGDEHDSFVGYIAGANLELPLIDRVSLRGEAWLAKNGADYRAGVGQSINSLTGEEIEAMGGWVELAVKPITRWSTHLGVSVDDPNPDQVEDGGRTLNRIIYFANMFNPYGSLWVGQEYAHWTTKYKALANGVDNRFVLYFMYKF